MNNTKKIKHPKMSQAKMGTQYRLGKTMTEEAKQARKEKMGKKLESYKRVPIIDTDTNVAYPSISHAANALGISFYRIFRGLKNKKKLTSGQYFIRVDERFPAGF